MTRTINARHAGTCMCSRQFAQGARITLDEHRRVISCWDCSTALKAETMRRLQAALDPTLDANRSRL
jgi:Zn finger protein HypA/HybF involved in hydrogenase expression